MQRAKSAELRRQKAADEKEALLQNIETAEPLHLTPLCHPKEYLVEARSFAPDYGAGPVCAPLSFRLRQGERMALLSLIHICVRLLKKRGKLDLYPLAAGEGGERAVEHFRVRLQPVELQEQPPFLQRRKTVLQSCKSHGIIQRERKGEAGYRHRYGDRAGDRGQRLSLIHILPAEAEMCWAV